MDSSERVDPADSILRRTVHVSSVPVGSSENEIRALFENFGNILQVKLDKAPKADDLIAFVQFTNDEGSIEALRTQSVHFRDRVLRISPSRVTIDVIPPIDAVFGKPMTVGRHVMAVNPSVLTAEKAQRRDNALKAVDIAAATIIKSISDRIGRDVSQGDFSS